MVNKETLKGTRVTKTKKETKKKSRRRKIRGGTRRKVKKKEKERREKKISSVYSNSPGNIIYLTQNVNLLSFLPSLVFQRSPSNFSTILIAMAFPSCLIPLPHSLVSPL